jgi:LmbE family N-acetylglucosaminyl deacetylase
MKKAPFLGKRIAVLTAHPDDEGLAAGTMYENHKAGGETFLICATYGEKGKAHLAKSISDARLKKIRRDELLKAAKILKITKVIFLGLPDTGLRRRKKKFLKESRQAVREIKPDYILSFGPEGLSGHWDHITAGAVARAVAKELGVRMFAFTFPDEAIDWRRRSTLFLKRRRFGKYAAVPGHRKADLRVKVDPRIKRRAMGSHKSQFPMGTPFTSFPKRLRDKMLGYEHFVKEKV